MVEIAPLDTVPIANEVIKQELYDQFINTKYVYSNAKDKTLIIENSFPKGGLEYTDLLGNTFIYAIFWTRITNSTDQPFDFSIHFPADAFLLPNSTDNYCRIVLPKAMMSLDKAPMFNYGLPNLAVVLDPILDQPSDFESIIPPMTSCIFYVITLFNHGVEGSIRAGLSIQNQSLIYTINDTTIHCGVIDDEPLIWKE
ncbi:MAG: hypothetical protein R2730_12150 [Chitinophagales bacterium]